MPSDLEDDPVITEMNFSDMPIIQVVLSGPFSLKRLKVFAEELEDRFEAIPGVLDARIIGGLEREIHVEFDLDRVGAYNVPFTSMLQAVERGNVNMPGGSMDIGDMRYQVRVPEDFRNPAEIDSIVAFVRDGRPVYLRDVASIRDHYKDPTTRSRLNGQNAVTLQIVKRSGENIIDINDQVAAIVTEMKAFLAAVPDHQPDGGHGRGHPQHGLGPGEQHPHGPHPSPGRGALFHRRALGRVRVRGHPPVHARHLRHAARLRHHLEHGRALFPHPGARHARGQTVSSSSENIYRHMQEGKDRFQAALVGTSEVAWPVITSTLRPRWAPSFP